MKNSEPIVSYKLLDSGSFKKLEQVGDLKFVRPAASAIWSPAKPQLWSDADWEFVRTQGEGGSWKPLTSKKFESYKARVGPLIFHLKPTPFGHLGVFSEQVDYWLKLQEVCHQPEMNKVKVLNLFAYTGGSSLAAALGGAEVVHLDASKTSTEWAKENASLNSVDPTSIRWIVDDVMSFVKREARRGNKYHGIILDPPSYGRGSKSQLWKIEEDLPKLLTEIQSLLEDNYLFLHLSAHTPGLSALSLENLLRSQFGNNQNFYTEEMKVTSEYGYALPSGSSTWMSR